VTPMLEKTRIQGDDESIFLLFYSAYRPDSVSHKTSSRWTAECFRGAYRICLLVSRLIAFACLSAPSAIYWVRYGREAWDNAAEGSFGTIAAVEFISLLQFLGNTIRESPGLVPSFVLTAAALIYLVTKRRLIRSWPDLLALLIMIGYVIVVLASPNRRIRFALPAIVALPFLTAILMSGKGHSVTGRFAALAAAVVFCGLLAAGVPTGHRANVQSLSRSDAVLVQAARCNAKNIMLATDSPTLNLSLMALAIELSASGVSAGTLAYQRDKPIEEAFSLMSESDLVVFQDGDALDPPWANQRVSEYERYIRQGGSVAIRVGDDISIYSMRCKLT
jgi:hypothetical protein